MQKITFTGAQGDKLAARLDMPDRQPLAYALFAHCFTCSKDIKAANHIAKTLNADGFAVLRFDFTGLGQSAGEFSNTNFSSNVADLLAAADYMRATYEAPSLLIGHSLGGAAVIAAASEIIEVKAVATIGAPADVAHVAHHFADKHDEIMSEGEVEVCLVGRPFKIKKQFLEDIAAQAIDRHLQNLKAALLVCHAPLDEIVGIENATQIFINAKHSKSFVSLDQADHLLSRAEDAQYAAHVIAAWAQRYVHDRREDTSQMRANIKSDHTALAVSDGRGKFTHNIYWSGGHRILADEPVALGGKGEGPNPYDFLSAALASCKAMTMRMYADHKGFPLEGTMVKVCHHKIHAEDCDDCESQESQIDEFHCEVSVNGDNLSKDQKQRIYDVAAKCPVHKTLHNEVKIRSSYKEDMERG